MNDYRICLETCPNPATSFFSLGRESSTLRKEIDGLGDYSFSITPLCLKYRPDAWEKCFHSGELREDRRFPKFKSRHGSDMANHASTVWS